jgi:hypothetical protein
LGAIARSRRQFADVDVHVAREEHVTRWQQLAAGVCETAQHALGAEDACQRVVLPHTVLDGESHAHIRLAQGLERLRSARRLHGDNENVGAAQLCGIREHVDRRRELREPIDLQTVATQLRSAPLADQHRDGMTRAREMRADDRADRTGAEDREFGSSRGHGKREDSTIRALHGRGCRDCIGVRCDGSSG